MYSLLQCASVRVYRREIYDTCTPNLSSTMAGIGEVCTLKSVRKQGIARRLMTEALSDSYATTCTYSMLHAASWIWPLYQSLGYVNISMRWTSLSFGTSCPPFSDEKMTFSSIVVKENVHSLHQLYTAFSGRYFGPLKRSIEYFESWIASESDRAYVISHDRELVAYIMVGERYGTVKIKDFGLGQSLIDSVLSSEHGKQSVRHSILHLIFEGIGHYAKSLPHLGNPAPDGTIQEDRRFPDVDVPTALALFLGCCDEDGFYGMKAGSADEGWMVRSSDGAQPRKKDELFLFWPVDHF